MTDRIICPVHNMPDCSPLLNGCNIVIEAHKALAEASKENQAEHRFRREIQWAIDRFLDDLDSKANELELDESQITAILYDEGYTDIAEYWENWIEDGKDD